MADSLSQVRVINPVLSTHAQGYRNAEHVHHLLFPRVPVYVSGGQVLEFGKEAFKAYSTLRAPGSTTRRLNIGYTGKPFALKNHALEGQVPREHLRDAAVTPGIDLGTRSVNTVMRALQLELEIEAADLATDLNNYDASHKVTLAGGDKWSTATGTPLDDIWTAKEAVRTSAGLYPNTAIFGAVAWKAFILNTQVKDQVKYTINDTVTEEQAARILQLDKVAVGKCVKAADDGTMSDVWGNFVVLAYTELGSPAQEAPSYGYCYTMDGHPLVEEAYYDPNTKSWIYPVAYERVPVLSGIVAGYVIKDPN
jgi:hypothetical protein